MKFETAAELYRHVRLQDIIPFALPADKKRLLIEAIDNYAKDYHESEVKNVSSNSCVSGQFCVSHSLKVTKSYKWTHQLCEDNKENRLQFFALRHAFEAGVDWCVEECNRKMKETENLR